MTSSNERRDDDVLVAWIAAAAVLILHLVANPHYGYFRDELYFIVCGFHPDWGYVDQPPLVPLMSAVTQLFGHSLVLLRAVPALFAAAGAYVACRLASAFGGGRFAQALAATVFALTGQLASFGGMASTDEVGLWTWPLIALYVVRLSRGADPRWWLAVGALTGVTLESKYSIVFFVAALVIGIALTRTRTILWNGWLVAGCALALALALPNVLWQWQHGFPMIELLQNGQNGKNIVPAPWFYLVQELLITTPPLSAVWIIGLVRLLRAPSLRCLGIAYVVLIVEMLVFHGKHYYPAAVYTILIAAGAVAIESWTRALPVARAAVLACAFVFGLLFLPFSLPVLPEEAFVAYAARVNDVVHLQSALETEHGRDAGALTGDFADMHGWPELAGAVRNVYDALPPGERTDAVVLGRDYGDASAVSFFTPGVPVISVHNQFWEWGFHGYSGNLLVQVGGTCFAAEHYYTSRTVVATLRSRWARDPVVSIAICRGIRRPMAEVWASARNFN